MKREPPKTRSRSKKPAASVLAADVPPQPLSPSVPADVLPQPVRSVLPELSQAFSEIETIGKSLQQALLSGGDLTGLERKRLIGVQARKYGFITRAWEIAAARPNFRPNNFSLEDMTTVRDDMEQARNLLVLIDGLRRLVEDFVLKGNDVLYHDALLIYRVLQAQARSRIHGAEDLFAELFQFFKSCGQRPNRTEPTLREQERNAMRLLHGTADGEMMIRHESPRKEGGVHEVEVKE